jgi:DNA-binding NtrC family response regulator
MSEGRIMSKRASIIIIDDEPLVRETLSNILRDEGYSVETAKDGREAIDKSEKVFFNLALIDIRLPDTEGTSLLTEMKERTPRMRKVIMTGYPSLQNTLEALQKGADAYIVKPPRTEKLLTVIREQLNKQQENEQVAE